MPLRTWKYPENKRWSDIGPHRRFNQIVFMHNGTDPDMPALPVMIALTHKAPEITFGRSPERWDTGIGNALVMRDDGQPLKLDEADASGDFCNYHLGAYFDAYWESSASSSTAGKAQEFKRRTGIEACQ